MSKMTVLIKILKFIAKQKRQLQETDRDKSDYVLKFST